MTNLKTKTLAITSVLMLIFALLMAGISSVKAAEIKTYAFLAINPNPVGVNQQVTCIIWVFPNAPTAADVFHNFTVTITDPHGTKETKGPMQSWPMGAASFVYKPTKVGNYALKFSYPGETFSSTGDVYLACETPITTLMVQEEPIPEWPRAELPTDYWTRPINAENREWASISGNWLMARYNATYTGFSDAVSGFNPYSQAPRSPHIVWTKELGLGGLTGGEYGSSSYYSGQSYDPYLSPPIIINGRLYYRLGKSFWEFQGYYPGFVCVDLRTGQELWRNEEGYIDVGQLYLYNTPNGHGVIPYLWDVSGDTWEVYDAFTGALAFRFENATSGTVLWWTDVVVYGSDGTMYVYLLDGINKWFAMWNSTKAFYENGLFWSFTPGVYMFSPWEDTFDWRKGIEWNVTIPDRCVTDPSVGLVGPVRQGVANNVLVAKVSNGGNKVYYEIGYDMSTGLELWVNEDPVQTWFNVFGDGIYASFDYATMRWTGYDIKTGIKLWTSDPNDYPWGAYINYAPIIAYGKLYSGSLDGCIHAFDIKTGKQVWNFSSGATVETVFNTWPFWNGPIIADGVLFVGTGEETPTQPLTRGNKVFAIDANTGKEIWNISGYMSLRAIADGYLVGYNGYDNHIYCFGKGPSAATIEGPSVAVSSGSTVIIRGKVLDESSGQPATPAVAKESMSAWMEYLHMQKPVPAEVNGVPVELYAVYPDGSYNYIGTAETEPLAGGVYGFAWTPPKEGTYILIAVFKGDESYGSSSAGTVIHVTSATAEKDQAIQAAIEGMQSFNIVLVMLVVIAIAIGVYSIYDHRKLRKTI